MKLKNHKFNKKGFTLIELLAVIVILAIIALIATPLILGVIEDSKKESLKVSAYGILNAGELYLASNNIDKLDIDIDKKDSEGNKLLKYKGKSPKGHIVINELGESEIYVVEGKWCAYKELSKSSDVQVIDYKKETAPSNVVSRCKKEAVVQPEVPTDGSYTLKDLPRNEYGDVTEYFYDNILREDINSIKFIKEANIPTDGIDISQNGNTIKMKSTKVNIDGVERYDIIISSNNIIYSNENCENYFYQMENINELDLSNFNTYKTTNMSNMFANTGHLSAIFSLNLSSFDTSQVTNMNGMFLNTGYNSPIFGLNLEGFDTSKVEDMSFMFLNTGYSNTTFSLDLSSFNTTKVTNMNMMFVRTGNDNLDFKLDLKSFDFKEVVLYYNMLNDFKPANEIKVKDQLSKDFILKVRSDLTSVVIG